MKIIKPGKAQMFSPASIQTDESVPFVIAYDLLEESRQKLTDEEVALIGLSLHRLTTQSFAGSNLTPWSVQARQESVHQTLLD